jgi:hypothetical protein
MTLTNEMDADELAELRAAHATPFEKPSAKLARQRGLSLPTSPKPASPKPAPSPAAFGETNAVDPDELERVRALHAAPYARPKPAPKATDADAKPGASFLDAVEGDDKGGSKR